MFQAQFSSEIRCLMCFSEMMSKGRGECRRPQQSQSDALVFTHHPNSHQKRMGTVRFIHESLMLVSHVYEYVCVWADVASGIFQLFVHKTKPLLFSPREQYSCMWRMTHIFQSSVWLGCLGTVKVWGSLEEGHCRTNPSAESCQACRCVNCRDCVEILYTLLYDKTTLEEAVRAIR